MNFQNHFLTQNHILTKVFLSMLLMATLPLTVSAQKVFRLYEGKAPGSEHWVHQEIVYESPYNPTKAIRNVVDPTLEMYSPDPSMATGTAVVICPGGGFYYLEYEKEGTLIARWLANKGITAFVLKYRLTLTPEDTAEFHNYQNNSNSGARTVSRTAGNESAPGLPVSAIHLGGQDGIRAIEYLRNHAAELNVHPQKVGIMGFSAGAFVTMFSVLHAKPETMPDFAAPIYGGSLDGGKVPDNAPPIFIACAADDGIAARSPDLFKAWRDAGKPAELHIYSKGGHGFGLLPRNLPVDTWIERFYEWLLSSGF